MSISQDEIREFNSPTLSIINKKTKRSNKVSTPLDQSPLSEPSKHKDVFELFTVKTLSKHAKSKTITSESQDTSELSDDVFIRPRPVSVSSKSETKSYRDKINERFKTVKEKAARSSRKASVFKEVTEKIMLEKVKRECGDVDAELEAMRNRLKLHQSVETKDKYEFFCCEKCPQMELEENEENFMSTDNLTYRDELEFIKPQQVRTLLKSSEDALLFAAKSEPVDISDKIETDKPRYLHDEGLYITPKPEIPNRHLHILEQRLVRDHKKWFKCDGTLNFLENPCQKISYRPNFKLSSMEEVAAYFPPKTINNECEEVVVIRENLLQLKISSLHFSHHPLFSLEHVLAGKLKEFYHEYEESVSKNELTRLTGRLDGLRRTLQHHQEASSQSGDQSDKDDDVIKACRRDIKLIQEQVFEEGKKDRERIKSILRTWKAIKKLREENKYSSTSIKLVISKKKVNYEEDKEKYEQKFEQVYEEYLEYNMQKSKRKRQDEVEIKEELQERFKESFRAPGEPILSFSLNYENEITSIVDNNKESKRRSTVLSTKIAIKIVCNKMEVCKTKWVCLQDNFICNFDEVINIQLITIPKAITLEIIEQPKYLMKRTLGEISLKIPARNESESIRKKISFEKNEIVHYKHEGVGSGIKTETLLKDLEIEVDADERLNTSGILKYTLNWETPIELNDNNPGNTQKAINEVINKNGAINFEKLAEWMQHNTIDPQDPRNVVFFEYSLESNSDMISLTQQKNYFRLNQMERWQFCEPNIIEDNLRLKILQLRDKNEPEFDRMIVPNRIKEIPLDILADYKKRIALEKEALVEEDDEDENDIETRRRKGKKHLKQIHIKVFQKCKNSNNNLTFEDVVDEKLLPHFEKFFKAIVATLIAWFRWRPLNPVIHLKTSQEIKPRSFDLQSQITVIVHVISGLNVPEKNDNKKVKTFVEVEYNNHIETTSTSAGPHPNWNEKLTLPLDPSHLDYLNPNSLNGTIILNVYDESDKPLMKFGNQKGKTWLGSVEIPLSAICQRGIQGMFRVQKPQLLLRFERKESEQNKGAKSNSNLSNHEHTYLNIEVWMEPNIPKLNPSVEELPYADLPYIRDHALSWNEEYNANFPNRKFSVFAIDTNATTSCIVRYIKPLEPPQINVEGFDVTPDQCAKFVSLIPFTECNQFYQNIWLPVDIFLHFMIGSIIDHAVALTCYLLALKMEVWLLLGYGIPYGSTAYVLVKEYGNQVANYYLYDVVLGEKIYFTDPFCPLQRVYCVVNEHNIWANIQRSDDVPTMRFDLTRRFDWLPLFNNKVSAPTNSIHGRIKYLPTPSIDELEIIIDRKIRRKFAKLRQLDRTVWVHDVSNNFKTILSSFEKKEMYGKNFNAGELIKEYSGAYKIKGHIFHIPFTDVNAVVKKVKTLGLHLQDEQKIRFASAVLLKAYPNQVLTVWIFFAVVQEANEDKTLKNHEYDSS